MEIKKTQVAKSGTHVTPIKRVQRTEKLQKLERKANSNERQVLNAEQTVSVAPVSVMLSAHQQWNEKANIPANQLASQVTTDGW